MAVVGGTGFVGSAFVRWAKEHGVECVVLQRDDDPSSVRGCDLLIDANGNSSKLLATRDPLQDFAATVASVRRRVEAIQPQRYIYLSSCDVYPDCSRPASTEESQPLVPGQQSPYGFHKRMAEECVQHAAGSWLILRLGGMVGPAMRKNAIFDILHGDRMFLAPESRLQFMHTNDVARLAMEIARRVPTNEVYNLCGRGTVSLGEVLTWVGRDVSVEPRAPAVTYDVSLRSVLRVVEVPSTESTIRAFVRDETGATM